MVLPMLHTLPRFNSMKVRLKPCLQPIPMLGLMKFQFHEGPIKTVAAADFDKFTKEFQFHEGPIKTHIIGRIVPHLVCFNSMKVRLKR